MSTRKASRGCLHRFICNCQTLETAKQVTDKDTQGPHVHVAKYKKPV